MMGCKDCESERRLRIEWQRTAASRRQLLSERGQRIGNLKVKLADFDADNIALGKRLTTATAKLTAIRLRIGQALDHWQLPGILSTADATGILQWASSGEGNMPRQLRLDVPGDEPQPDTPTGHGFDWALQQMRAGRVVRRGGWADDMQSINKAFGSGPLHYIDAAGVATLVVNLHADSIIATDWIIDETGDKP